MITELNNTVIQNAQDAYFAYDKLQKNESGVWQIGTYDLFGNWEALGSDSQDAFQNKFPEGATILDSTYDPVSGFGATLIQNADGTKTLAIAGSKDPVDFFIADTDLASGNVPAAQYKVMTEFFDSLTAGGDEAMIKSSDILTVTGHSLGGTLTQLCTATYAEYVDQAYTYNSPGAADLVSIETQQDLAGWDSETLAHWDNFISNKENVGGKILNVMADEGISVAAIWGPDIGDELRIIGTSHLLEGMIVDMQGLKDAGLTTQAEIDAFRLQIERARGLLMAQATLTEEEWNLMINAQNNGFEPSFFMDQNNLNALNAMVNRAYGNNTCLTSGGTGANLMSDINTADTGADLALPPPPPYRDPLVLDLDGDGVEFVDLENSNAYFDLNGDNFATKSSWVSSDDGFLVYDRNGDGAINNVSELFGSPVQNGFDELANLDGNQDGVINALDGDFNNLQVWQDLNGDGISQEGELKSLSDYNITGINLANTVQSPVSGQDT